MLTLRAVADRLRWRLQAASRRPASGDWWITTLVAAIFLLIALPLAGNAGLIAPSSRPEPATTLLLLFRVLLLPALMEELLFRVLPNPHPLENAGRGKILLAAALSLSAYVLVHPLTDLLSPLPTPFDAPTFLFLATLLGAACLLLYRRSGSLWPPLVLHWLVVSGWLALGGGGVLPAAWQVG